MSDRHCRGCGKKIVWAIVDGKRIPLDPAAPTYMVVVASNDPDEPVTAIRTRVAMVSHFATCPKANDFSDSKKKPAPDGSIYPIGKEG